MRSLDDAAAAVAAALLEKEQRRSAVEAEHAQHQLLGEVRPAAHSATRRTRACCKAAGKRGVSSSASDEAYTFSRSRSHVATAARSASMSTGMPGCICMRGSELRIAQSYLHQRRVMHGARNSGAATVRLFA